MNDEKGRLEKNNEKKQKVKDMIQGVLDTSFKKTEEETLTLQHQTFRQEECPYGLCPNGQGYILKEDGNGNRYTEWCRCHQDEQMRRKLKRSKIEPKYYNATFEMPGSKVTLLHPKGDITGPEMIKKGKKEIPETAKDYMNRVYNIQPIKRGISVFGEDYSQKALEFLNQDPRQKSYSLMLMGEPGRGKTHLACAIGKKFIEQNKTVYFTTMLNLVNDVMNPAVNIKEIIRKVDLVIIDEIGSEYHTDTQWALKQIKELLRIRYNSHLPVVGTTNFYPNELYELYDASLISMFHGSYLYLLVEKDRDHRLEEVRDVFTDFSFLEGDE